MNDGDRGFVHREISFFGKMPVELIQNKDISSSAKVLYAHLHWRYGDNKAVFESQASMAEVFGCTTRSIRGWLRELEAGGWIITRHRQKLNGQYRTCFYHIFESTGQCAAYQQKLNNDYRKNISGGDEQRKKTSYGDRKNISYGLSGEQRKKTSDKLDPSFELDPIEESSEPQSASVPAPAGNTPTVKPWIDLSIAKIQTAYSDGNLTRDDLPALLAAEQAKDKPRDTLLKWIRPKINSPENPNKPDDWGDYVGVVTAVFNVTGGNASQIAEQLLGIAQEGKRAKFNCEQPPVSPDEVEMFGTWYAKETSGYRIPTTAENVSKWWNWFKNRGNNNGRNAGSGSESRTGGGEYRDSLYDFKGYQPNSGRATPVQDVRGRNI